MFVFLLFVLSTAALVVSAPTSRSTSDTWFTVEWDAPEFIAMSGDFVVPKVSTYGNDSASMIWPGLQGDNGVLQAELDRRLGISTLGISFYGLTGVQRGSRSQVFAGDMVHFSFARISSSMWMCSLTGPHDTELTLSLPGNTFNRAIFAVDLFNVLHDFTVAYSNVIITAASTNATDWCGTIASRGYEAGGYIVNNATAEGTTCRIGQIILPGMA